MIKYILSAILIIAVAISCTSVSGQKQYSASSGDNDLTVGKVKKEIRVGMSGAEVAEILGSPNIVTKDEEGKETWVYDKIATEVNYSDSQNAMFLIFYGQANQSGSSSMSQKTLTVVIKFVDDYVDSFTYHSSKF
jgi:outer membrane protein assembly factor BamE (lipoprotein component of BamABCDE complex)